MIIAIDGPSGSGKSTTAARVAESLGFMHLNTGAMYRSVALAVLNAGIDPVAAPDQTGDLASSISIAFDRDDSGVRTLLNGIDVSEALRAPDVTKMASVVSANPRVREEMVAVQRQIANEQVGQGSGVVLEGRDIGTVVFPNADLKIFLTASSRARAERRVEDLRRQGTVASVDLVQDQITERDARDSSREASPLTQAIDAVLVDTTTMTFEDQVDSILRLVAERREAVPDGLM